MTKVKIYQLECKRCGHKWLPRKDEVMICPKCKSPYWDRERITKEGSIDE